MRYTKAPNSAGVMDRPLEADLSTPVMGLSQKELLRYRALRTVGGMDTQNDRRIQLCEVSRSTAMTQSESTLPRRRLYRLKAAADYLSMSPWKLRRLIQEGHLPVVQDVDGSPFLLDVRDLDAYVERNKHAAVP